MAENWVIRIEVDEQIVFTSVWGDPTELGRQDEGTGELLYHRSIKPDGTWHMAIASNEEAQRVAPASSNRSDDTGPGADQKH